MLVKTTIDVRIAFYCHHAPYTGYNRYDSSGERHTPFRGLPLDGIAVCPAPLQTEDHSIVVTFATTSAFVDVILRSAAMMHCTSVRLVITLQLTDV